MHREEKKEAGQRSQATEQTDGEIHLWRQLYHYTEVGTSSSATRVMQIEAIGKRQGGLRG